MSLPVDPLSDSTGDTWAADGADGLSWDCGCTSPARKISPRMVAGGGVAEGSGSVRVVRLPMLANSPLGSWSRRRRGALSPTGRRTGVGSSDGTLGTDAAPVLDSGSVLPGAIGLAGGRASSAIGSTVGGKNSTGGTQITCPWPRGAPGDSSAYAVTAIRRRNAAVLSSR